MKMLAYNRNSFCSAGNNRVGAHEKLILITTQRCCHKLDCVHLDCTKFSAAAALRIYKLKWLLLSKATPSFIIIRFASAAERKLTVGDEVKMDRRKFIFIFHKFAVYWIDLLFRTDI